MKLIGLMSLEGFRDEIRSILKKHDVHIYSEVEIIGHTAATLKQHGWWPSEESDAIYSTLYFAIVSADKADGVFHDIERYNAEHDLRHPPRAFLVDVEKMI